MSDISMKVAIDFTTGGQRFCTICGVLVHDVAIHIDWHIALGAK